jgi:UDP-N-acetylmuramate--alanine ligase
MAALGLGVTDCFDAAVLVLIRRTSELAHYHFVGLAGIGMSGLAQLVTARGDTASGSDRYFDNGQELDRRDKLAALGVRIFPQDGTGVREGVTHLVLSSAIEESNPDLIQARRRQVAPIHRSALLAALFHACRDRVAITGSFGKTSITAMMGWVMADAGLSPMVVNGGIMRNFENEEWIGNVVPGNGRIACIEADESDGTCIKYKPTHGLITGFARDHKEMDELQDIYAAFSAHTTDRLIMSVQASASLFGMPGPQRVTFGLRDGDVRARNVRFLKREVRFNIKSTRFRLNQIGPFSVFNALATIATLRELGVSDARIESGLRSFEGIARHMEVVGRVRGVRIFDDFAHNPSKIAAAIEAVRRAGAKRVFAIYQPHGFGPARFMRRELALMFERMLGEGDRAYLLPIYYAGGSAAQDISSEDMAAEAREHGAPVESVATREALLDALTDLVQKDDAVLIMGARDNTLTDLCRAMADHLDHRK